MFFVVLGYVLMPLLLSVIFAELAFLKRLRFARYLVCFLFFLAIEVGTFFVLAENPIIKCETEKITESQAVEIVQASIDSGFTVDDWAGYPIERYTFPVMYTISEVYDSTGTGVLILKVTAMPFGENHLVLNDML